MFVSQNFNNWAITLAPGFWGRISSSLGWPWTHDSPPASALKCWGYKCNLNYVFLELKHEFSTDGRTEKSLNYHLESTIGNFSGLVVEFYVTT